GGMGIVLLARDVALDRLVAMKLLPQTVALDDEARARFLREARASAGLSHPNIVPIHTVEEQGHNVFFVMGYVDGETLRERVERAGPLTPRYAMKLMQEVAWALGYAHERGVVHRDIKPDNIMIEQATDRAMVTDFGIAQVGAPKGAPTGEIIGTARYMSPEQASGDKVDGRSDLYSLAATFYWALAGRAPHEGKNLPAILAKTVSEEPKALVTVRAETPERFASIVDQCLQKEPEHRIQKGEELASALGEVRGRDFRAPPLVRSFIRNAEISTMVFLATAVAGGGTSIGSQGVNVAFGGPGFIGTILVIQLILVARRLLREGYTFPDIREALLAEAQVQDEEAEVVLKWRWVRRLNGLWNRVWAGKFGRWFFRTAGKGIKPPAQSVLPSTDATELVLGRAAVDVFKELPKDDQTRAGDVPAVVHRLEGQAERLRQAGETGEVLHDTVAALENVRLVLLKVRSGQASIEDLTLHMQKAKEIGENVDRQLAAQKEVEGLLNP
ncbi:MAG: serine/threonine protein kinase, partial [Deltaproteobacteria bacterium]|nr:serine/threonine protein kinase [Deltaproteobacteria bacterium]